MDDKAKAISDAAGQPAPNYPIKPTVGRLVLYTPPADAGTTGNGVKDQPYPATITHVFSDTCVNLSVDQDGSFPLEETELHPTSVVIGTGPRTWDWMPYQYGQAKKAEDLSTNVAAQVAELSAQLSTLKSQFDSACSNLSDRIEGGSSRVSELFGRVGTLETNLGILAQRVDKTVSDIVAKVSAPYRASSPEGAIAGRSCVTDAICHLATHFGNDGSAITKEVHELLGVPLPTPPAANEPATEAKAGA